MALPTLSEQQQKEADRLAEALRPQAEDLLQRVARLLTAHSGAEAFGSTEFQLRALLLEAGAAFHQTALAQKKMATRARRSPAPTVSGPPLSTDIVPARGSSACWVPCNCAVPTTTAALAVRASPPSTSKPA